MEKSKENDDEGVIVKKGPSKVDKPNPPENYTFLLGDL
jgi:hypothetical protein